MKQWYLDSEDRSEDFDGPYDYDDIIRMLKRREISRHTLLWSSDADWTLLKDIPDFAKSMPPAPPSQTHDRKATQGRGNALIYYVFRAPGKKALWLNYMFARSGEVASSARQIGNPIMEVLYSLLFWFGVAVLLLWIGIWLWR